MITLINGMIAMVLFSGGLTLLAHHCFSLKWRKRWTWLALFVYVDLQHTGMTGTLLIAMLFAVFFSAHLLYRDRVQFISGARKAYRMIRK